MMGQPVELWVNIDHVATLRNARGGTHPDPVRAAGMVAEAGAQGITVHLREDRRHIRDADLEALDIWSRAGGLPINLEMAATDSMVEICEALAPLRCCLVPERREELTTEGGLDVVGQAGRLQGVIRRLQAAGVRVSLFVDPAPEIVAAACALAPDVVELHTGRFAASMGGPRTEQAEALACLGEAVALVGAGEVRLHAGHGLDADSLSLLVRTGWPFEAVHIGHALVGEAVFVSLPVIVSRLVGILAQAAPGGVSAA